MKKWILIATVLLTVLLAACGKEEKVVFEFDESGVKSEVTYYAKKDKVTKQTTKTTLDYSVLMIDSKEAAEEMFKDQFAEYEDVKGVKHKVTYNDDNLVEEVEVDLSKVDFDDLSELTGSQVDKDADYISLEESIKLMEDSGFTQKK